MITKTTVIVGTVKRKHDTVTKNNNTVTLERTKREFTIERNKKPWAKHTEIINKENIDPNNFSRFFSRGVETELEIKDFTSSSLKEIFAKAIVENLPVKVDFENTLQEGVFCHWLRKNESNSAFADKWHTIKLSARIIHNITDSNFKDVMELQIALNKYFNNPEIKVTK